MHEASGTTALLEQSVAVLGAALLFVTIFRRLGVGAVLGYLTAGILLGPQLLGVVPDPSGMAVVGDIGIAFLLFLAGLELDPARLWRLKKDIFALGVAQVIVCGAVLALLVALLRDVSLAAAVAIGMPLALSSTAQVLPFLRSTGEINTRPGERAFAILLLQDLAIVPMLIILSTLSRSGPAAEQPAWQPILFSVLAVAGLVAAGKFLLNPLLRIVGRVSERELFVVTGLFTVIAAAAVMHALGLSTALGAFVAGVMLADSPYRHELEADIDPFRSILLGLFFISVGMSLDLATIAERPLAILVFAAVLVSVKAGLIFGVARLLGVAQREAARLGLLLSQGGEFAFVLFAAGAGGGLIGQAAVSTYSAVVTLSMVTTPFLMMLNERWMRLTDAKQPDRDDLDGPEAAPPGRAVVIGYGRFGQTVAQMLMAKAIEVVLIDSKATQIEVSDSFGMKVYYGDGTRIDLLRQAGAGEAQVLLFCIDGDTLDARAMEPILEAFPQARVYVRAFDRRQVMALEGADIAGVYRELFESAVCMGREALRALCVDPAEVDRIERAYRERDSVRLAKQSESGDLKALKETMFRPGETVGEGEGTAG